MVQIRYRSHQRKSQASSIRVRPAFGTVGSRLDAIALIFRHTGTVVGNDQRRPAPAEYLDQNLCAFLSVVNRILYEIDQQLGQEFAVARYCDIWHDGCVQPLSRIFRDGCVTVGYLECECAQIQRLKSCTARSGLDLRDPKECRKSG